MKGKLCKVGLKVTIAVLIAQIISFIALFLIINNTVSNSSHESAVNNLKTTADDRAEIIDDYIISAENHLTAYLKAEQIHNLLENSTDSGYTADAQKYTEAYSADIANLEGIYASIWDTTVLTHTNAPVIGMVTRPDEAARKPLHDSMIAADGVYNAGIIISPASQQQIISMYKAVQNDNGDYIGLGGIGIFTSGLVEKLDKLSTDNSSSAQYYLVNANTGEYIFHPDKEMITTVAQEQYVLDIIEKVKASADTQLCDFTTYKGEGGEYIAAFNSMNKYGWVFIITDNSSYIAQHDLRNIMLLICAVIVIALSGVVYFVINMTMKPIKKVEKAIVKLGNMQLNAGEDIRDLASANDEMGHVAETVITLCESMKNVIEDISRILGEISSKNLTVDITQNKDCYIGAFNDILQSIQRIQGNLAEVIGNISTASEQVNVGAGQIASGAQNLSTGSVEQNASIDLLAQSISEFDKCIAQNSESCGQARSIMEKTSDNVIELNGKMSRLLDAMTAINENSEQIRNIIKTIEDIAFQTNILALNAAVEAARAGDVGKGFSVVADEVRNLAGKTSDAVNITTSLIENTINAIENGSSVTKETVEAMDQLSSYISNATEIIENVAEYGAQQSEMVSNISLDVDKITTVVQANSATAEQSAAASEELSGQASMLHDLVVEFKLTNNE